MRRDLSEDEIKVIRKMALRQPRPIWRYISHVLLARETRRYQPAGYTSAWPAAEDIIDAALIWDQQPEGNLFWLFAYTQARGKASDALDARGVHRWGDVFPFDYICTPMQELP